MLFAVVFFLITGFLSLDSSDDLKNIAIRSEQHLSQVKAAKAFHDEVNQLLLSYATMIEKKIEETNELEKMVGKLETSVQQPKQPSYQYY